jgi:hypothetical protein
MPKETIESYIVNLLIKGPTPIPVIVRSAIKEKSVTKEAVYKALRLLLRKEISVKRGKIISLSNQWVIDMAEKWRDAESRYVGKSYAQLLGDKSSVVYTCKTIDQLDSLWNHVILDISYTLKPKTTMLFYSPHYWFPMIRSTSEHSLIHTLTKRGHTWLQLSGYTKPLDVHLKKYFPLKGVEYYTKDINEKNYINVFEQYFVEVTLDKKATDYINKWYSKYTTFTTESVAELEKVLKIKGSYKLKISKNQKKVEKFRKLFSKYFLIK